MYIENVIGFHTVNAFERVVMWHKPNEFKKALGITDTTSLRKEVSPHGETGDTDGSGND